MEPLYDLYYVFEEILKTVQDVNADRASKSEPENQWIWPEVPTSLDNCYPRLTIQFLNLEEQPVSAGGYISDNFGTGDANKCMVKGKIYNVTMWIGLFVKAELKHTIDKPDGQPITAKNALLGNLLFTNILKAIDANEDKIQEVAYNYRPYEKTFALGYEDNSKRIINAVTITVPVLSKTEIVFNANELIETIVKNYEVNGQNANDTN